VNEDQDVEKQENRGIEEDEQLFHIKRNKVDKRCMHGLGNSKIGIPVKYCTNFKLID